jgi:hypothetical protein
MIVTRKSEFKRAKRARVEAKKCLLELEHLAVASDPALPSCIDSYLDCAAGKYWAARRSISDLGMQRLGAAADIANQIDVRRPCSETITQSPGKQRSDGSRQPLLEFGLIQTARQLLVLDVLRATKPLPDHQFQAPRKGHNRAVEFALSKIAQGHIYFYRADIASCFESFVEQAAIAEITGLPEAVVAHTVLVPPIAYVATVKGREVVSNERRNERTDGRTNERTIRTGNSTSASVAPSGPRLSGLAYGGKHSSYCCGLLLADIPSMVPAGVVIIAYMDDLLILARTEGERTDAHRT